MKKRILSLVLLVATLITAIPVMAVTAADAEAPVVYTNEEYAELYAKQENLVHLYMAYANADTENDHAITNGEGYWRDLKKVGLGQKDASFSKGTGSSWVVEEKGGISYSAPNNLTPGNKITFGIDAFKDAESKWFAEYTVDSAIKVVNRKIQSTLTTWKASDITATKDEAAGTTTYVGAEIGVAHAASSSTYGCSTYVTLSVVSSSAKRNITIQVQSAADGTMVNQTIEVPKNTTSVVACVNANGQSGFKIIAGDADVVGVTGASRIASISSNGQNQASYSFGYMFVLRWHNMYGSSAGKVAVNHADNNGVGRTRWAAGADLGATYSQASSVFATLTSASDHFVKNDGMALSLAVIKGVNADGTKDAWQVYNGEINVGSAEAKGLSNSDNAYDTVTGKPTFFMMSQEQGTIYAVRIYNTKLTKAEVNYNHLVDILAYQGGDIEAFLAIPAEYRAVMAEAFAGVSVDDATLSAIESYYSNAGYDYSALYVGADGSKTAAGGSLIGLYTAFAGESDQYDVANKVWKNKMDATKNAVLRDNSNTTSWMPAKAGGLTLNYGSAVNRTSQFTYDNKGLIAYEMTYSAWSNDGYTKTGIDLPEAWASLSNLTVEAASVLYGLRGSTYTKVDNNSEETFRIDILIDLSMPSFEGSDTANIGNIARTSKSTAYYVVAGRNDNYRKVILANDKSATGLTSRWTKATSSTHVTFGQAYNTGVGKIDVPSFTLESYATHKATQTPAINWLSLFNRSFHDVYAIRVYNAVLTESEALYNHFIDLLAFYQIEMPEGADAATCLFRFGGAGLPGDFAATTFVYDDNGVGDDYSTVKEALQAAVDKVLYAEQTYADLYIKKAASGAQLVGLFTAFKGDKDAGMYDISGNKWYNRVGLADGDDITLKQTSTYYYSVAENGGIKANGIKTAGDTVKKDDIRMNLPVAWAAYDNFTLETAQVFHSRAGTDNGWPENVYNMRIDLLRYHYASGVLHSDATYGGGTWHANTTKIWYSGGKDNAYRILYHANGKAAGGDTMWVSKVTGEDGSVTYDYGHSYVGPNQLTADVYCGTYTAEEYEAAKGKRDFYIFGAMPVESYAIRVYNGALTEEEKKYNHLIDLLAFYQVELPENVTRQMIEPLAAGFYNTTMVHDNNGAGDDYDAVKARLQREIMPATKTAYDKLYVAQENLIGLYTAFGDDASALPAHGLWKNKAQLGNNATLYDNTTYADWQVAGDKGGLSLKYTEKKAWDNTGVKGASIRLNEDWASLENFTVETSNVAYGIYVANSDGSGTGGQNFGNFNNSPNFEETFCLDMISTACYFNLYSNNGIGMGFVTRMEGVCGANWWSSEARSEIYRSLFTSVNPGSSTNNFGTIPAGLTVVYTKSTTETDVTFAASASSEKTVNIDGGKQYAGSYTYTKTKYGEVVKNATITGGHKFSLYNRGMFDVYAIRVYNKVLTDSEKQFNHLVDLLAFYGVEIPETVGSVQLATIASKYARTVFVYSNDGNSAYRHDTIKKNLTKDVLLLQPFGKTAYDELYAAKENLIALYTAFGTDSDSVVLDAGTWRNKVVGQADATLVNTATGVTITAGEKGGISFGGITQGNYSSLPGKVGIKLTDDYLNLTAFTVESTSILTALRYTNEDGTANKLNSDGDYQHFRFGALNCDYWPNLNSGSDFGMHMSWRNIPIKSVAGGDYWYNGQRDQVLKNAYIAVGRQYWVGLTQTVTMEKTEEGRTYGVYYGDQHRELSSTLAKDNISEEQYEATLAAEKKKLGSFYLFSGTPGDVYAIRVYNKALNESERLQNHFVDLLAFYEIDIANMDMAAMAAMAGDYVSLAFFKDEAKYNETKATLQSAVDRLVTIQVGDASETHYVPKGGYTLPETIEGKTLFGYEIDGASYAPGKVVTSAATVKALAVDEIKISNTVDATVLSGKTEKGEAYENLVAVRFNAEINKQQFLAMNALVGGGSMNIVELGILIVPLSYVEQAAGDDMTLAEAFNMETLLSWYATHENPSAREHTGAYLDVNADYFRAGHEEGDEFFILSGGFGKFSESTLTNDPLFAAVAYFEVEYKDAGGNPIGSGVIYGAFEEEKCIRVSEVLSLARTQLDPNSRQYEIISGAVHSFEEKQNENGAEAN